MQQQPQSCSARTGRLAVIGTAIVGGMSLLAACGDTGTQPVPPPPPPLAFSADHIVTGPGLRTSPVRVTLPSAATSAVTVRLTSSDATIASSADVVIQPGARFADAPIVAKAPGTITLVATADGVAPDTVVVEVQRLRVRLERASYRGEFTPTTFTTTEYGTTYAHRAGVILESDDPQHPNRVVETALPITLRSADGRILEGDAGTIAPGDSYTELLYPGGRGVGVTWLHYEVPGGIPDSNAVVVQPLEVHFSHFSTSVGLAQRGGFNVSVATALGELIDPVSISIRSTRGLVSVSDVTMPAGPQNSPTGTPIVVRVPSVGVALGVDTLVLGGTNVLPDTLVVLVTPRQLMILIEGGRSDPVTFNVGETLRHHPFTADTTGRRNAPVDAVRLHVTSDAPDVLEVLDEWIVIAPDGADAGMALYRLRALKPGSALITVTDPTGFYPSASGTFSVRAATN